MHAVCLLEQVGVDGVGKRYVSESQGPGGICALTLTSTRRPPQTSKTSCDFYRESMRLCVSVREVTK